MPDAVFGPLIDGGEVEHAVIETLKRWMPEYLAYAERKTGRAKRALQAPRSYVATTDLNRWPEEQLPSVLVMNTGLAEEPARDGRGKYRAKFALGVAVVIGARDRAEVGELAKLYTAVVRAVLLQQSDLGGLARAVEWVDEGYDALPPDRQRRRQLAAGQAVFRVEVPDVTSALAGPAPDPPRPDPHTPYPDDPTVETTETIVEPEEL